MRFKFLFFSFFTSIIFSSCTSTQKIAALKPESDDASALIYENATSFVNLPITIQLKDVENQVNKSLNGLIYEDNNIEDDNLTVKIWKLAPILLENNQVGKIKTILPLKATINYRYGIDKFGVSLYDTREINLNGKVNLVSNIGLTNWKLTTQTELKSLDWNNSPTITIAGKSIAITYLINPAINYFKTDIEKSIDDAIKKSLDFKPNVLDALEKICTPTEMSTEYESWLRIVPVELYATDALLKNGMIKMDMGLKCYIETLIGQQPESKFDRNKIILKPVLKMPDNINANIVAVSTYQDATKMMTKNFQGQEFGEGKKKVTVQNVAIWHKGGKMVIALDLSGSVNGTVYLSGFPQYNETTKEIYFDQLMYVLDTKNKLVKSANWLLSSLVLKKIQENCRYSISSNLEEGKQIMLTYTKNYSPIPGVFINGAIGDITFKKIQLTNKAIVAFLNINGKVNVAIDGLK
ncbi:MAG: hypothetical protein A3K10_12500 [Bacteroidetes bacterium RIFCSPLOWO2_12_FULL_31_6]|nr:MAG: hypothetical protein A3K10_12500 [Bacteroidetes bacterium RIFCSPLOWO2_12_FULL_31_6]